MLTRKMTWEELIERLAPCDDETINRLRDKRQKLEHLLRDGGELWEWIFAESEGLAIVHEGEIVWSEFTHRTLY